MTIQRNPIGCGTVFKISNLSNSPIETVIHDFGSGEDGSGSLTSLVQSSDGSLYGTTPGAVAQVFRISNPATSPGFSVIYRFTEESADFASSLIQASDGALYGTTANGRVGAGTIFKITNPATSPAESVIYRFTGGSDGGGPEAALIQASDGKLYGTALGGSAGAGVVFSLDLRTTRPPLRLTPAPPAHPAPIRDAKRSTPPAK